MAKDNNKKTLIGIVIVVCLVIIAAVSAVVIINSNNNTNDTNSGNTQSGTSVTSSELVSSTPSVEIAYGDYEAMRALSKDIQNGKRTGQIVTIDGIVNHPGSAYSVVQKSSDGTTKIGTVFNIDDSTDYPAEDTRIVITAKVVEVSPMNFQLVTLKDFIKEK